jgi:hypothetical protein
MRGVALSVLFVLVLAGPAAAFDNSDGDYYTNVSGHRVHRPEHAKKTPPGATAHCRDGTWSFSEHHSGTCSHHGGVASWL